MNLLITARRIATAARDAVRSVIAPAALVADQAAAVEPVEAPDPADTYTADEMPELVAIERAALGFDLAADNARRADRAKRAARKVLDRLPAGTYGNWIVERVTSNRQTADLDAIRAIFKANGLGPVPMKSNAPSLRVTRAELGAPADTVTAALAGVAA
ncbi:hypothetical protein QBB33_15570 [Streptomyces scabiei]|uniref:hypothetical protein n=1 Tax=Streptomyces scabiei TaxID=1930 RepID=UPI002FF0B8AF